MVVLDVAILPKQSRKLPLLSFDSKLLGDLLHAQSERSAPLRHALRPNPKDRTLSQAPQWEAADAEIKVPSDENTEFKGSPFIKAWSRSVYRHACYAYFQGFLPC